MKNENPEIQAIRTFEKDPRIHVYYLGCDPNILFEKHTVHDSLEDAYRFVRSLWGEQIPTIVEYKRANLLIPYQGLKQEDFMAEASNKDSPISLDEARAIWKTLPHPKNSGGSLWTPAELFSKQMLLSYYSEEELNKKVGFTWEESFKPGFELRSRHESVTIDECSNSSPDPRFKNQFYTRKQAESALAFAQLSHIVAKYNGSQTKDHCIYKITKMNSGELVVHDSTISAHLEFYSATDAETSLRVNNELWKKYWMI